MEHCDEYRVSILLYLEDELKGQELEDFHAHLATCASCEVRLQEEKALTLLLRRTRPLYAAPEKLRARVSGSAVSGHGPILVDEPGVDEFGGDEPGVFHWQVGQILPPSLRNSAQFIRWRAVAASVLLLAAGLAILPMLVRQTRAADYIDMAVATHRSYIGGDLPLEFRSDSPEAVTAWFAGKVPFNFQLPSYRAGRDEKTIYQLTGARLINYRGSHAALVTYGMQNEKISLLVASSKLAAAAGGDQIRSEGLIFHYHRNDNFKVITWANHGLTYALVSSLSSSAKGPCLVCHENMRDEDRFRVSQ